jgi:hypothetical protein
MPGTAVAHQAAPAASGKNAPPPPALRPFFPGTLDLETHTYSVTNQLSASSIALPTFYPKTNGFLADLWIRLQATAGATAGTLLTTTFDGIFSYLQSIIVSDTGGQPILGPMTGGEFYWFTKWGGFSFSDDARNSETFSEVSTVGNGNFTLHIPIQFVRNEPLGPLPNTNSNNSFAVDIIQAPASAVFSANPGTLPTINVQIYQDSYRQSAGKDAQGNPTVTTPPGMGAVLYARRTINTTTAGSQDIQLSQQEGSYRAVNFILKDSTGSRTQGDADWPSPTQVYFNNDIPYDRTKDFWIRREERDYNYTKVLTAAQNPVAGRDLGVFTLNFLTDGGSPQAVYEQRYKYLSVSAADTLGWRGVIGGSGTHTLTTLFNFVRPPGGNIKGLTSR